MRWLQSILLLPLLGLVSALSSTGKRLLVVQEEASEKSKYSEFWDDLSARGYSLSFESPKSDKLALLKYGELNYDHVLILPPRSKGLGPSLAPKLILEYIKNNGNVMLALSADSPVPAALSSFLLELDIQLSPDRSSLTVDHFNYDTVSASDKHDVLLLPQPGALRSDVKNFFGGDGIIAFPRAVAQALGNESPLIAPILRAGATAYCYNPKEEGEVMEEPFATGAQISLVSTMQARNSARFTVFGSVEALENTWFNAKVQTPSSKAKVATANRAFAKQVTAWTFQEIGVLKVGTIQHYLSDASIDGSSTTNDSLSNKVGGLNPSIYRVKNGITFNIELSEYSMDKLCPPALPADDALQLEFTMLSPYHRLPLLPVSQTPNSTIYSATFTAPDQHGIFSFRVNYKRPFLTNIEIKEEITVRHFAHDEWPRSWRISGAWVWIAGIWVTILGWLVFVGLWLWSEPTGQKAKGKKVQ